MAETALPRRSSFAGILTLGRGGRPEGAAGITIRQIDDFRAWQIIAKKDKIQIICNVLSDFFNQKVEDKPCRASLDSISLVGLSPGQWRLVSREDSAPDALRSLLAGLRPLAMVVEQGDGLALMEVSGPMSRRAFAKGVPVDLHPSVFKPGDVVQTAAAHIGLQLALINEQPTFELITAASTLGSLWSWLAASAAEFGYQVV